jgi:pimeloyl-ACP methyl ester carboxylesterase
MPSRSVTVVGARGGHGASTVAAVLALTTAVTATTELITRDVPAMAALLGVGDVRCAGVSLSEPLVLRGSDDESRMGVSVIRDADTAGDDAHCDALLAVLRGPCYVGLHTLARAGRRLDGIVLLAEPERTIEARDVEGVLGAPVVATVPVTGRVARTIDAGLLIARYARLTEFASLRRYVNTRLGLIEAAAMTREHASDASLRSSAHRPRPGAEPAPKIVTDWPVPLCGTGGSSAARRETRVRCASPCRDLVSGGGAHAQYRHAEPRGGRVLHR